MLRKQVRIFVQFVLRSLSSKIQESRAMALLAIGELPAKKEITTGRPLLGTFRYKLSL